MHRRYLKLKACPRCGGDILVDNAMEDGEVCIQCGYRKFEIPESVRLSIELEHTQEYTGPRRRGRPRKIRNYQL
jgi:ribosomal protein S27AE